MNAAHIAHRAVLDRQAGKAVTPATITNDLIADGCTPPQAASLTKMACALIPTVTATSLRAYLASTR